MYNCEKYCKKQKQKKKVYIPNIIRYIKWNLYHIYVEVDGALVTWKKVPRIVVPYYLEGE